MFSSETKPRTQYVTLGLPLPTILTLIFLILKLTGVITWGWFWIFSPLVFAVGLVVAFWIIAMIIIGIAGLIVYIDENKDEKKK